MVSRAAKHVFSRYLRKLPLLDVPGCVAHLLNCLVGFKLNPCPQAQTQENEYSSASPEPEWAQLSASQMQEHISKEVLRRYRFKLQDDWWNQFNPTMLLREICLKLGFQLKAREYTFEKPAVLTNGTTKSKKTVNGVNGHKSAEVTFYPEDLLNVVPIVKDAPLKVSPP
jgi:protein TIF31